MNIRHAPESPTSDLLVTHHWPHFCATPVAVDEEDELVDVVVRVEEVVDVIIVLDELVLLVVVIEVVDFDVLDPSPIGVTGDKTSAPIPVVMGACSIYTPLQYQSSAEVTAGVPGMRRTPGACQSAPFYMQEIRKCAHVRVYDVKAHARNGGMLIRDDLLQ